MNSQKQFSGNANYIHLVNEKMISELLESCDHSEDGRFYPEGRFLAKSSNVWVAVDNSTRDAWTEEFEDIECALSWLRGEFEMSDLELNNTSNDEESLKEAMQKIRDLTKSIKELEAENTELLAGYQKQCEGCIHDDTDDDDGTDENFGCPCRQCDNHQWRARWWHLPALIG